MSAIDEVRQAHAAHIAGLNQGNVAALMDLLHPQGTFFHIDGNLLNLNPDHQTLQQGYAAGLAYQVQMRHEQIDLYDNSAVVTAYAVGSITWPGGKTLSGTWRYTSVWIKTDGAWRNVHVHASPLTPLHSTT